jgi:hypothetical protein
MAGAQLFVGTAVVANIGSFVTCPLDESWLVYTISIYGNPSADDPVLVLTSANTGATAQLAIRGPVDTTSTMGYLGPSIVMNAGDTLSLQGSLGTLYDVYISGLIQRGPGLVPS